MGLDYSYELLTTHAGAERALRALTKHLHPYDHDRILAALDHGISEFERHVQRNTCDGSCWLCLTFLFPPDEVLSASSDLLDYDDIIGRVAIGCVDLTLRFGESYVLLRNKAVTTDMSLLFAQSPNIRKAFRQVGQESEALLVTFDDEQENVLAVWPEEQRLGISFYAEVDHEEGDEQLSKVDCYMRRLMERKK